MSSKCGKTGGASTLSEFFTLPIPWKRRKSISTVICRCRTERGSEKRRGDALYAKFDSGYDRQLRQTQSSQEYGLDNGEVTNIKKKHL